MSGRVGAYLRQNALGLIAIFLALTAGAYAVQKAPKNSVVSKSIKNGQVRNQDLGAGAVTGDKIAPDAVSADRLGFDPATQGELDANSAALSALASPGTINQSGNPVDWTKLKGVPDGFADGFDRLFGLAARDNSGDTTPSVANLSVLTFGGGGSPMTVTDLEDPVDGQIVTLHRALGAAPVTIADAGSFVLSADWTPSVGDTLTLARTSAAVGGGFWIEVARSAN